ncbi:hypothetical protein A3F00_04460 [Candidatus Daviesbacteria bacterium RIFCSPHIGHO2_12_FULL_37_11]|uniref:Glutamyl-tRNA amidotransferase n=1 Tax=Candidatus Daviesbacteria bacterium RIFCSPHIGHO2_12_FULL_37_11 TaxID=1797777 RepID=A0A1F5K9U4_9BACT|nr:MAG: hypothetical protein A2111_01950 [Candidatus Daviesbacteria bacterium GWA1_38_6]OGE16153.1 MAG: hypothetical protein A2769_03630 [Candidatus Daviesbacteria bacterium RIFCSPHIGHO2_01_FULL_37_27]OGE37676.1 MAG: hypothetical protein A3F00_04460 [Candidatus Daviesbacteria bacterium RIFCSPHIGHO2_12_FULL_37_11]OGE45431.1 MAG: hypothetical protein A3B39_04860 [Candidatus Daviesbacteria bacterium RIFCSPLOWO2_01_FULL_37_10]
MQDELKEDLKNAQLEKNEVKVSTLRLLLSEIHNVEIKKNGQLSDDDLISIIQREVKKRKEAISAFRQGGREDQAQKEEAEAKILENYLPAQISDEELTEIVEGSIKEVGATGISDMGKVIGAVMSKVSGRADGGRVSQTVREKLMTNTYD